MRIGFGFDLHPLTEDRELVLGGIRIPCSKGLLGHSDADCLVHAICDAILGAIGRGDIGEHFPDTDDQYHGISSIRLLERVLGMAEECGYRVGNLDTTIVADFPRLSPYKEAMIRKISQTLGIEENRVSIKATTTNGLILFARKGIAAYAVVCLEPR
jgi:2-C-methyl-D-erythritol 2,4-cyclodiphosphate synthase